jgi:DNA-binding NtrC family response regulator
MMSRILVVDDDEPIREILRSFLESHGYGCIVVPNGIDAMRLLDFGEHFDLLIHDISNAPWDGFTLRDALRRKYPRLTTIVHTAAPDIGYENYLKKGLDFELDDLLTMVRRILGSQWNSGQ